MKTIIQKIWHDLLAATAGLFTPRSIVALAAMLAVFFCLAALRLAFRY